MTALLLAADPAARGATGPAHRCAGGESLGDARRATGDRLNHLVDGLLDVSRIETGRLPLALAEVDLGEVVRDVVERFEPELTRAGCPVSIRGDASVMGRWDRSRLDQVVTNLLANAVKFGLGKPIEIVLEEHAGVARLVVRDHGIGIDEDEQPRIFERFTRAVSSSNYGGLGLGLYISRCIVEAHGGRIGVLSERASGSTFTVELPCAPSDDARGGAVGREGDAARS
jgi:signal transduction histidine kinase